MARPVDPVRPAPAEPENDGLPVLPPLAAIGELAVAFAIIHGIDWLRPELGVLDMQPHPFWIPLLLLSLQYGTVSGLVAAGVAIAATMSAGLPEAGIGENHFAYFLRVWGQPILWIAMALLVGQFRMRQIASKQELRRVNHALARQRADLAAHCARLRERGEMLDRELATRQGAGPLQALAALAAVERQLASGAPPSPADVLARLAPVAFPGGRLTLLAVAADGALRNADAGPASGAHELDAGHPLARALERGGEAIGVLDRGGEALLAGVALAAAPVRGADGAAVGVLLLDGVAPKSLGSEGLAALSLIATRVGAAKDRAKGEKARAAAAGQIVAPTLASSTLIAPTAGTSRPARRRHVAWTRAPREGAAAAPRATAET